MTLLNRVRNVLGLAARPGRGRWWPVAVLALLVPPAIWLASTAAVTSAQEGKKPHAESWDMPADGHDHGKYTASAYLRIAMDVPTITGAAVPFDRDRFEIYKNTQRQLLQSRFVLLAALRKPDVSKLASVQNEIQAGDPATWLAHKLQVSHPGNAEIMEVSLSSDDPKEAAILVNAVVGAYLTEVVNAERILIRERLSELDRACSEKETDIRMKREDLKKLAERLGASDTETLTLKQKMAIEELSLLRQEIGKLQGELRGLKRQLAAQKVLEASAPETQREIKRLETEIAVGTEQQAKLEKEAEQKQHEAERFGNVTVDVEMMRAEIKTMDIVLTGIVAEREKVKVECRAAPRVTLIQKAEVPVTPQKRSSSESVPIPFEPRKGSEAPRSGR